MAPDVIHFAIMLLLVGTLIRLAQYTMAQSLSDNLFYKYLVFAY